MNSTQASSAVPSSDELQALIGGTSPLNMADIERHINEGKPLDRDPAYTAISLRSDVVSQIYDGLEELKISPSELARRWGKSRQYLSDILKEDKPRNFTIDTIVEIMDLLGRKVEMRFPKYEEPEETDEYVGTSKWFWQTKKGGNPALFKRLVQWGSGEQIDPVWNYPTENEPAREACLGYESWEKHQVPERLKVRSLNALSNECF